MIKKVSIVIRCLNENSNLKVLIPKLLNQTYKNYEVVFVDSGSTDGTLQTINKYLKINEKFSLHHIKKSEFTFGRSLNLGFSNVSGNLIVSLSAHCFPKNTYWLESIVDSFENPNVGIVYGSQSPHSDTRHSEASVQKSWFSGNSRIRNEVFLNNGNAAYRKEIWEKFKFDEKLTGLEDIDIGLRAKANGWDIYYCTEAEVEHLHYESYKTIRNRYRREAEAMKNINKTKTSDNKIIKNTLFHCLKGFFRGVQYDLKTSKESLQPNNDFISILMYRTNQYLGTFKGYKNNMNKNRMTDLYFYPPKL